MKIFSTFCQIVFICCISTRVFAGNPTPIDSPVVTLKKISPPNDSTSIGHNPKKAVILSAILPGAGQVYNKKYWKIPIIYAAGGYFVYNVITNNKNYLNFRDGFRLIADTANRISKVIIDNELYDGEQCRSNRNLFRRQRDLNIFATLLIYTLNIVDAHIDAHFYGFKMDNDLSFQLKPNILPVQSSIYYGFQCTVKIPQ